MRAIQKFCRCLVSDAGGRAPLQIRDIPADLGIGCGERHDF